MADSRSRLLTLVQPPAPDDEDPGPAPLLEDGLADVVTLQRRKEAALSSGDEEGFFLDTVAEYQWARDAAGLAPATLDGLTKPIIEVCRHYDLVPLAAEPASSRQVLRRSGQTRPSDGPPQDDPDRPLLRVP